MAVETRNATLRSNVTPGTTQIKVGVGSVSVHLDATIETAAAASIASVYAFARLPTNARIQGNSRIWADDLASTGSPVLNIGLRAVGANFTTGLTALNSGLVASSAIAGVPVVADIANYGKMLWEHLALATDPGGFADVVVSVATAALVEAGTITMTLVYSVD